MQNIIHSAAFVQGVGFAGMAAFFLSYQIKSNKALYICQFVGAALFCLQFLLLDAASGCFSLLLTMLRSLLLLRYNEWPWVRSKVLPLLLIGGFTAIMYNTWAGLPTLLAFVASAFSTVCYWTNNARTIRMANLLVASPCWLVHDYLTNSIGGMLCEGFTIVSILVSLYRFGWKALGEPEKAAE